MLFRFTRSTLLVNSPGAIPMPVEQSSAEESFSTPLLQLLSNSFSEPSGWIWRIVKFSPSPAVRIKLRVGSTEIFSETSCFMGKGAPKILVLRFRSEEHTSELHSLRH